jgi:coproporphyrinogen dehydrogenase HemZ
MIGITVNVESFGHELRSLVMAFYPDEDIKVGHFEEADIFIDAFIYVKEVSVKVTSIDNINDIIKECELVKFVDEASIEKELVKYDNKELIDNKFISLNPKYRLEYKNAVKRALYNALSKKTGKQQPWGTLTGIRPTKIPVAFLEIGKTEDEIFEIMKNSYLTSNEKIKLSIETAKREVDLLKKIDYKNGYSIYIGIPFCPTTCVYCSFTSYPIKSWEVRVDEYLEALFKEIDYVSKRFSKKCLNTIYIGGGTPTSLSAKHLDKLFKKISDSFDFSNVVEWTVEAGRPDSITEDKLIVMQNYPISRISINPQTMKEETLKLIGRRHSADDIIKVFKLARKNGFDNINMDIIVGLPEETLDDITYTLEEIVKLAPDSLTVHSLAVKRAAKLNTDKADFIDFKIQNTSDMIDMTSKYAKKMGLAPYYLYRQKNMAGNFENVGYALKGKFSFYNILIMEEKQHIIALGAGGSSKIVFQNDGHIERIENLKDVGLYIEKIDDMIARKEKILKKL